MRRNKGKWRKEKRKKRGNPFRNDSQISIYVLFFPFFLGGGARILVMLHMCQAVISSDLMTSQSLWFTESPPRRTWLPSPEPRLRPPEVDDNERLAGLFPARPTSRSPVHVVFVFQPLVDSSLSRLSNSEGMFTAPRNKHNLWSIMIPGGHDAWPWSSYE